jgi:hypothetical protein
MSDFEKGLAEKVLEEKWPNRPEEVNPENLIDISKQLILVEYLELKISPENLSIAETYKKIGEKFMTTGGDVDPAEEIENETEFGKDWLKSVYDVNIKLMKRNYHNQ